MNPVVIGTAGAAASDLTIGSAPGSTGALNITGAGSLTTQLTNNGLAVGDWGNGTLTISGGGTLTSPYAVLGNNFNSTGNVVVTGAGSTWNAGTLYVAADQSTANVTVSAGGKLTAYVVDIADFVPGGSGAVTVTGAGSNFTGTGSLSVGTLGSGAFNVTNGASANISGAFGIGSIQGSGAFNVLGGGTVVSSTANPVMIGSISSGGATATVSGTGSTWTVTGQFNGDALDISGVASTSTLTIANGGQVIVAPTAGGLGAGNVVIGSAGNAASMVVDGAGSTFTSPTNLVIGAAGLAGSASLTITNGGSVQLTTPGSTVTLGGSSGSSAALNIGAAAGSAAVAPGTLNVGSVVFATTTPGPLSINFNHTSSSYVFSPQITGTGPGSVNLLAGTTIFTANDTYSGNTTIAAGATLQLGNGGASGWVKTNIADNGALIVNHSASFPSTFNPYVNVLSGNGTFSLTGGGSLTLNGDSSGFAGTTYIYNSALSIAADTNGTGKLGGAAADIGVNAGNNGSISVYNTSPGSGAALGISGNLTIGDAGTGSLGISNGAKVSDGSAVIGAQSGSSGSAAIASGGSSWTNAGTLGIGLNGSGYLSIGAGSTVSDSNAYIGQNSGSSGKVILAGTGALWTNGGVVTIAAQAGSTGVLDIGAPVGIGPLNPGAMTASSIQFGAGNGALNFNHNSSNYVFSTPVAGVGTVNVFAGTTILTANNTYIGATNISAGAILQLGAGGTSGSILSSVTDNGILAFNRSDHVTFAGGISGTGALTKLGAGALTLSGTNNYTGATLIAAGALVGGTTNAFSANSATTANSGGVLDLGGFSQTINAVSLAGGTLQNGSLTGAVTSTGGTINGLGGSASVTTTAGTTTVLGTNTYTGGTSVTGSTLVVNGSITDPTINSGGVLSGTGSVGATTINSGGMLAPGNAANPTGTLTITGNLAFQSGALYLVQITPAAASLTSVTGAATLGNATVNAIYASGSYVAKQYTILTATGSVSGTFGSLVNTNLPSDFTPSLSYDANDAYLDLKLSFSVPTGLTVNQQSVGNALINSFNTTGGIPLVFGALSPAALTQLDGEAATGAERGAFQLMNEFLGLMLDPFVDGRGGNAAGGGPAMRLTAEAQASLPPDIALAYARVLKAPPPQTFDQRWNIWGAAFGGSNSTNGNAVIGSNNVTAATYGFASGVDYRLTPSTVVGLALAGGGTNWGLAQGLGGGRSDAFQAGVYGITHAGPAYLSAALAFTNNWFTTSRTALGDQLTAGFTSQSYGARIEGGNRYAVLPAFGVTPYAAVQAQSFRTPNYSETDLTNGGFGLAYNATNATDVRTEVGSRFDAPTLLSGMPLILRGRLAWAHDFVGNPSLNATFQALPGASFMVNGAPIAHDSALASAGAELVVTPHLSVLAKLNGEFATGSQTYAGTGTVRYTW